MFPKFSGRVGCLGPPWTSPGDELGSVFFFQVPVNVRNAIRHIRQVVKRTEKLSSLVESNVVGQTSFSWPLIFSTFLTPTWGRRGVNGWLGWGCGQSCVTLRRRKYSFIKLHSGSTWIFSFTILKWKKLRRWIEVSSSLSFCLWGSVSYYLLLSRQQRWSCLSQQGSQKCLCSRGPPTSWTLSMYLPRNYFQSE